MIEKRIHVRVEHVRPNRARELHRERVRKNEEIKKQARISHIRVPIKRLVRSIISFMTFRLVEYGYLFLDNTVFAHTHT